MWFSFMLPFRVFAGHQTRSSLPELSLFPPPSGPSPFFSCDCTLFFSTASRQPLWNQLLAHCFRGDRGCALPDLSDVQTGSVRSNVFRTYHFSFHTLAHSLARSKTQLFSQSIPHSLPENSGGGGTFS